MGQAACSGRAGTGRRPILVSLTMRPTKNDEKDYKSRYDQKPKCDLVGVIEVEVPEGIPLKPLKKKIDELVKEEEARWVLFERAKEEINLSEAEL